MRMDVEQKERSDGWRYRQRCVCNTRNQTQMDSEKQRLRVKVAPLPKTERNSECTALSTTRGQAVLASRWYVRWELQTY